MPEVADTCSLASPASICRTQHLHLRCSVDFARRALTGTAALRVQSQEDNLRSLVRVACAAPLLRGCCPPAPRPCSLRALRSLALPAWPLLGLCTSFSAPTLIPSSAPRLHQHSFLSSPRMMVSSRSLLFSWIHLSVLAPLTHSWDTSSYSHSQSPRLPPPTLWPLFPWPTSQNPLQAPDFASPSAPSLTPQAHPTLRSHTLCFSPLEFPALSTPF